MTVVSKLFTAFLLGSRTSAAWWQFCGAECLCRVHFCLRVARARVCVCTRVYVYARVKRREERVETCSKIRTDELTRRLPQVI